MDGDTPKTSWILKFLPIIYQNDSGAKRLLERFLATFESRFDESERLINKMPRYFDPEQVIADDEDMRHLSWLESWLALDNLEYIGAEKNRKLTQSAVELYKQKGTPRGLKNLAEILTGHPCKVKEYTYNIFWSWAPEQCLANCTDLQRVASRSVDTSDPALLRDMGTYYDRVHYVSDYSENGLYSARRVGLFVFVPSTNPDALEGEYHLQILNMLEAFLPVLIKLRLIAVNLDEESYSLSRVVETYSDTVIESFEESAGHPDGEFDGKRFWNVAEIKILNTATNENHPKNVNSKEHSTYLLLKGKV